MESDLDREPWELNPVHEADDARQERWGAFIAFVQQARVPTLLWHVGNLMDDRSDWHMEGTLVYQQLRDFADEFGWHGVLSAIAHAMREAESRPPGAA